MSNEQKTKKIRVVIDVDYISGRTTEELISDIDADLGRFIGNRLLSSSLDHEDEEVDEYDVTITERE